MQNILRKGLLVIGLVCLFIPAGAQESEDFDALFDDIETEQPQAGEPAAADAVEAGLSAEHSLEFPFPVSAEDFIFSDPLNTPRMKNLFTLYYRGSDINLSSSWHLDIEDYTSDPARSGVSLIPGENFIAWDSEWFRLSAGLRYYNWGSADGLNPTDNLNPRDYTQGADVEKVPVFSLAGMFYPADSLSLEAVYIPLAREDRFPLAAAALIPAALFDPAEVTTGSIPFEPASFSAAAKVSYYTARMDISASYVYDYDSYFTPEIDFVSVMDKSVNLGLKRIHRIGLDVKLTTGMLGLWLEGCLSLPESYGDAGYSGRGLALAWTGGFDFLWGPDSGFYTNLQYTGRFVPDFYSDFFTDYPGGQPDPVQYATSAAYATEYLSLALTDSLGNVTEGLYNGIILNQDFSFLNEKIALSLRGAFFFPINYDDAEKKRIGSVVLQPQLGFKPAEAFEICLSSHLHYAWMKEGAEVVFDDSDPIGMYRSSNNVVLSLSYKWNGYFKN